MVTFSIPGKKCGGCIHKETDMFRCFRSAEGMIILGLVAMAAIYLVVRHSVHLAAVAPFLLLLACPLMHVLMHRTGHGGHHHSANNDARKERVR